MFRGVRTCFPGAIAYLFSVTSALPVLLSLQFYLRYLFRGGRKCVPTAIPYSFTVTALLHYSVDHVEGELSEYGSGVSFSEGQGWSPMHGLSTR